MKEESSDSSLDLEGSLGTLGDIRAYPTHTADAVQRAERARQVDIASIGRRANNIVFQELCRCEDIIAWEDGVSQLPRCRVIGSDVLHTNYMLFITPGESVKRADYSTAEEYKRHRRITVQRDLAKYYRFNLTMVRQKNKLAIAIQCATRKLHAALCMYPGARFQCVHDDGRVLCVGHRELNAMTRAFELMISEHIYAMRARGIRNPFAPQEPENYLGKHQRLAFSPQVCRWMKQERHLERFRHYIAGEDFGVSYMARGMSTLHSMCLVFRVVLGSRVQAYHSSPGDRVLHRYETTADMRELLSAPEYIGVLQLTGYVRKTAMSHGVTSEQRDFLSHDDDGEDFAELLAYVQEFADHAVEERRGSRGK